MKTDRYRVKPGTRVRLSTFDPAATGSFSDKDKARDALAGSIERLQDLQDVLYADNTRSLLLIIQAMDAAGKDGVIKHVMSGVNPQGCQVYSFKAPSAEELDHDYLWRCMKALPERGRIGIFNRSYYEEVIVVRVHPELLSAQRLPKGTTGEAIWKNRFEDINALEKYLARNGTTILKFFLHVSKKEQKKRFLERIDEPSKNWKFSGADVRERAFWDDYMRAYEEMLTHTSTEHAPWYVIPADHKWFTRTAVAAVIIETLESLSLKYPKATEEHRAALTKARQDLETE